MTDGGSSIRKVAIVGSADTSRDQAPYDDLTWEIWTLNDMCQVSPRIDRLFEIHCSEILERDKVEMAHEISWLKENESVEVWMADPQPWVPMARQFPTEVLVKEFGTYFTNSVSWMIALALHEGVDELGIWGVDMAHGTEYAAQRPSCEYMIGLARGRGVDVYLPTQSDLLKCSQLYGLAPSPVLANIEARIKRLNESREQFKLQKTEAMLNEAKIDGALEVLNYYHAAWAKG